MNANLASIMPQVLAVWCEERGHDVRLICYTGFEDLVEELPEDIDLLLVGAFSQGAQVAYAVSAMFRARGVVTCIGGPHARCYPEDAAKYFDYVLGFTDQETLDEVLEECETHRPRGRHVTAEQQPRTLPGVRERWKYIVPTLAKAPTFKLVPMLGSLGCPYTCSFCIDSEVTYQPLDFGQMTEDLRFLLTKFRRPRVGWHDPNFGVRFDDYLDAIEAAVPPGEIDFVAESSLSLLSEDRLKRLEHNGFRAMLPGIESWFSLGNKSKARKKHGREKLEQVSEHANLISRHVDYLQTNFVLGLDCDEGPEPFELTKRFVDRSPAAFPGYSLLTAFGRAAPLNLEYQKDDRVLGFPFHFLNNHHAMNVKPLNYEWPEFYDHVIDLTAYSFSPRAVARRFAANGGVIPRLMNVVRAVSSEGKGRLRYFKEVRRRLDEDTGFRDYFEGESDELPQFFVNRVREDLGPLWEWLPDGALYHDPLAYLKAEEGNGTRATSGEESATAERSGGSSGSLPMAGSDGAASGDRSAAAGG